MMYAQPPQMGTGKMRIQPMNYYDPTNKYNQGGMTPETIIYDQAAPPQLPPTAMPPQMAPPPPTVSPMPPQMAPPPPLRPPPQFQPMLHNDQTMFDNGGFVDPYKRRLLQQYYGNGFNSNNPLMY